VPLPILYSGLAWWSAAKSVSVLATELEVKLAIEPAFAIVTAATNPWHHEFCAGAVLTGSPPLMAPQPGPAFWVHTAYGYALLAWAMFALVRAGLQAPRRARPGDDRSGDRLLWTLCVITVRVRVGSANLLPGALPAISS
jgi:hypothetical protein